MSAAPVIAARGVRKSYGSFEALRGIDLEVEPGEVFSILGPNGAGKTTFIEILEGYRSRSAGDVSVLGVDPATASEAWKARIGVVLQATGVFAKLTVDEVVSHFATFYPDPLPVGHVIRLTGLEEKRRARCESLSGGQKRRVDVALGIIGNPELIFLDEPTTGFDPSARRQSWDMIEGLTRLGKTIILTTHYLDEAEHLADRVAVIVNGEVADLGTPAAIGGRDRALVRVQFRREGPLAGVALPAVETPTHDTAALAVYHTANPTALVTALAEWARGHGHDELPGLEVVRPSLEDTYLRMIGQDPAATAATGATQ